MNNTYKVKIIFVFKAVGWLLQLLFFFFSFQQIIQATSPPISESTQSQGMSQKKSKETNAAKKPIAFVNANLIPMDREIVIPNQTLIIRGDRIEAIGPSETISIPRGAIIINATGRYLVPGLTDAHVHLARDNGARSDFGDAPLFLSYGITTVFNLRGIPDQLIWKDKIQHQDWLVPNLYSVGEFIDEPRVVTPEEVEKAIAKQIHAGYDIIKYHEFSGKGEPTTTIGLSMAAYKRMNETAARLKIPIIGHAPHNLGFQALLDAHQSLSHVGELVVLYFFPLKYRRLLDWANMLSYCLIFLVLICFSIVKLKNKFLKQISQIDSQYSRQILWLTISLLLIGLLDGVCYSISIHAGLINGNRWPLIFFSILSILIIFGSTRIIILTWRLWRQPPLFVFWKISCLLLSISTIVFSLSLIFMGFVSWRHTESGLKRVSQQCHNAGIWIQSTLVCYEIFSRINQHEKPQLLQDSNLQYIPFSLRKYWEYQDDSSRISYNTSFLKICQKTIGALHRAGVPIMTGTDAIGCPFVIPGSSLHRELQLLLKSGLTPYEVLRTATIVPAQFLKKQEEFGTIVVGKRADLLLVDGNPLVDIGYLKQPLGVMVRGKWLSREQLNKMLASF